MQIPSSPVPPGLSHQAARSVPDCTAACNYSLWPPSDRYTTHNSVGMKPITTNNASSTRANPPWTRALAPDDVRRAAVIMNHHRELGVNMRLCRVFTGKTLRKGSRKSHDVLEDVFFCTAARAYVQHLQQMMRPLGLFSSGTNKLLNCTREPSPT